MSFGAWSLERLVLAGLALPYALLLVLGVASLLGRPIREAVTGYLAPLSFGGSFAAFVLAWPALVATPGQRILLSTSSWFPAEDAGLQIALVADPLALWLATLSMGVCGVIAAFSHRYLHDDPGYNRYFVQLSVFAGGLLLVVLSASIEVLFAGWELLGLSSALLAGFFHDRPLPVKNALYVFGVYRVGDAAMLTAAVLVHHYVGSGNLALVFGADAALSTGQATVVGALLLVAAAAKCAQLPFSNWLPRAMEGPTPSSAVLYGALSVHAGAFLLLRAAPILDRSPIIAVALGLLAATTAVYATITGRAQTDVKSALAFASLTQVSIILVEIAFGLRILAMVHMTGHALLRTLQFLRAPSILHEVHELENAIGAHLGHVGVHPEARLGSRRRRWLYRFALERGHVDGWLRLAIIGPFIAVFRALDALDRRVCDVLAHRSLETAEYEGTDEPREESRRARP